MALIGPTGRPVAMRMGPKTRKPCYRKDDRVMRPIYTGKLLTLILFTLTAILCTDFDSEQI